MFGRGPAFGLNGLHEDAAEPRSAVGLDHPDAALDFAVACHGGQVSVVQIGRPPWECFPICPRHVFISVKPMPLRLSYHRLTDEDVRVLRAGLR